jgi:predicted XRE-type DNA-binding protein
MTTLQKPKRRWMNPAIAAQIKKLAQTKTLYQHEIAAMLGINQGRVSEVLTGKRYSNVPPMS